MSKIKVKSCEVNKVKAGELPCYNRAKHTLKIYHKELGQRLRIKIAICDLHCELIEQNARLGNDVDMIKVGKQNRNTSQKYGAVLIKGRLP